MIPHLILNREVMNIIGELMKGENSLKVCNQFYSMSNVDTRRESHTANGRPSIHYLGHDSQTELSTTQECCD